MNDYFVTGTGTDVGKTVLSAILVAALNAVYWKPIQTGVSEGTDRETVGRWAEVDGDLLPPERYRFDPPVSPHLASREAGVRISLKNFDLPVAPLDARWIVEGAGGVMVPINERDLMRGLIRRIGFPVIVVSRTSLGTINHTLLTLAALRELKLRISGVALNGEENVENRRAIEHYGDVPVIGRIPPLEQINRTVLLDVYKKHFDHLAFQ